MKFIPVSEVLDKVYLYTIIWYYICENITSFTQDEFQILLQNKNKIFIVTETFAENESMTNNNANCQKISEYCYITDVNDAFLLKLQYQ